MCKLFVERRTFTPRLGRGSGEITVHTRAQPLTPRYVEARDKTSYQYSRSKPFHRPITNDNNDDTIILYCWREG